MCRATELPTPPPSVTSENPALKSEATPSKNKWWNANQPQEQWTMRCPVYLQDQPLKNINILSSLDENYPMLSWAEVKHTIDTNRIDLFHRRPIDLRRYLQYCYQLKQQYGSILFFLQQIRLNWPLIKPSPDPPFQNTEDYKILYNDWPYAIDSDVLHIVIWTKFMLADDPSTGELTTKNKALVEGFISDTFCSKTLGEAAVDRANLRWFKNWTNLRSVHALEHIHVMIYRPSLEFIKQVTHNDKPMSEKLADI